MENEEEQEAKFHPLKVTVEAAANGLILRDDEGQNHVFEIEDSWGETDMEKMIPFLYTLMESVGHINQKYAKHNVEIRVVHGRGFDCKEKDCPICKEETR